MKKNIAIKTQNLSKVYPLYANSQDRLKEALNPFKKLYHKDFFALNNINFEIKKGEVVGIIGKNGCGKSTLLKIITGVLIPSSGSVHVNGKISAILELGAGFNPELTGLENIFLNMLLNGYSKKQADKKINEITSFAELGDFIRQPTKIYSSGMKARLAFAVAINIEPDILIIDEALSVGDAAFQRKCFSKMEEIRSSGATILFVSHSEGSIVSLCDRALWLNRGGLVLDGVPKFITGLYLKYSSVPHINKEKVINEYQELIIKKEALEDMTENGALGSSAKVIQNNKLKINAVEEIYSPAVKSTSSIYYKEQGAKICDVKITTLDGRKINILIQGKEYIYQYIVKPQKSLMNVQFGFFIKTKNGVALGGGAYPDKNAFVEKLNKTTVVKIRFKCELNNGEYFFNAGILAKIGEKVDYAHRIIDAYMIKVIKADDQITGVMNFISHISIKEKVNIEA